MEIQSFDSYEEMFETIHQARKAADARVKPWQAAIKLGDHFVRVDALGGDLLTIYGEVIESPYPEDREVFAQPHMKHYRLTRCFSLACPEGEIGDVHVSTINKLMDKETFELARITGWPSLVGGEMP